jgi:3-keto-disaccharide hydrolase
MTPPVGGVMIYLPGMVQIIALIVSAVLLLPAAQKAGQWKSLFDGKSMDAWRIYKSDKAPKQCQPADDGKNCWEVKDGVLTKEGHADDIVSKDQFGDFELELEWNIGKAGNSGVFYRGTEEYDAIYWSAPEYQLLDNVNASDNKQDNHLAGSVYDLFAVPKDAAKPAGEWNRTRIVAKGNHIEHWLNGKKVAQYDIGSPAWESAYNASKFNKYPNFAKAKKGYLGIQGNHPGTLELRNIRIRELQ